MYFFSKQISPHLFQENVNVFRWNFIILAENRDHNISPGSKILFLFLRTMVMLKIVAAQPLIAFNENIWKLSTYVQY
jgi:hypothetical protein